MDPKKVSIKLLIDTKKNKVLFAEAGKDFVDFLFFLMGLPMGTVFGLLDKDSVGGSIGNIYKSIENLNQKYLKSEETKNLLLKPMLSAAYSSGCVLLSIGANYEEKKYFQCRLHDGITGYMSDDPRTKCPQCARTMSSPVRYVPYVRPETEVSSVIEGGFVNGAATFMVLDDLVVEPMSGISAINWLKNKFDVKEFGYLQEQVVHLDMAQGLELLKSSFNTKNVLTTVFLGELEMKSG